MGILTSVSDQALSQEQREFTRHSIALEGKIFVPAEQTTLDCHILNISGGDAGVQCEEPPTLQTFVVLFIDGFGRFEAITTRHRQGELGLRFVCRELKRQRLLQDIETFVREGGSSKTRLRRHLRTPSLSSGYFGRPNGEQVRCDVLDISLQGISLRTVSRPPIGDLINLGRMYGRVVRHHSEGIAIQFLELAQRHSDGE